MRVLSNRLKPIIEVIDGTKQPELSQHYIPHYLVITPGKTAIKMMMV